MAAQTAPAGVDYGIDTPQVMRDWWGRAAWTLGVGLFVWFINHQEYPGPSASILGILAVLAALFAGVAWFHQRSSREGKLALREQLLDSLALQGDEKILDVGCGRGLLAIGAAKRLKSGRVIAIDTWNPLMLSGNSADAAKENAKAEGVADRVRFDPGDPRKLSFPENSFDVVTAFRALGELGDDAERTRAIQEMYRVLKPGGRLLIFDTTETGYFAHLLRTAGAKDVTLSAWSFPWCLPSRRVTAQK
jgi:ubiquinone/menaquinone biosynthesis C-methylase UbiE